MFEKVKEENILFLDIETVSSTYKFDDLDERFKDLWTKKMRFQIERDNSSPEEIYSKAAIWAEFGKIICISVGYLINKSGNPVLRVKSFYGKNEKDLLLNFNSLLNKHFNKDKHYLCAHNGKEFDFPYIARRMLVNGIKLPKILSIAGKKPWEVKHIDTLELWKFGDYKHYTSLDLLAALFDIKSPKTDIDGSMVNKVFWEENDLQRITNYCQNDVTTLCHLYLKLKGLSTENIAINIAEATLSN